jgi:hypothetical protein
VPTDTANVLWTEPEDSEIFASLRDVPACASLFAAPTPQAKLASGRPGKFGVSPGSTPARISSRTASQNICVS